MSRRYYRLQANLTHQEADQLIAHLYLLIEQLQIKTYSEDSVKQIDCNTEEEGEDGIPWDDSIPF